MSDLNTLYEQHKVPIVCAATIAAGPDASATQIAERVAVMLDLFSDVSPLNSVVSRAVASDGKREASKGFTGTIIHVDIEESSDRGIIVLRTGSSAKGVVDGQEIQRTPRFDSPQAEQATRLYTKAVELIGHKVGVEHYKEKNEKSGFEFRSLAGLKDRGPEADYRPGEAPWFLSPNLKVNFNSWQGARQAGYQGDNRNK